MIPESFIADLKDRNDIESVMSSYVQLRHRGRTLVGLCPFHSEKTPSMTVYPESQSFFCFGCGAGGDVVTFIKKMENLDYVEALKFLADKSGMVLPEDDADNAVLQMRDRVFKINKALARYYFNCLKEPGGKKALEYLTGRGITGKTIVHFGLGYSPDNWDSAVGYLRSLHFTDEELVAANVATRSKDGKRLFDRFRGRVMFPIIDIRGNVIAFGGRIMDTGEPKYLNSSDTPVFKKSRNLYALNFAKSVKDEAFILAEGYMDVIAMHQAGFENAVATLGTAITPEQARLIAQYVKKVIIAYDADNAGQTASAKAVTLLGQAGVDVHILKMDGAKDPDEYIKKFGKVKFAQLLDQSAGVLDFEINKLKKKNDLETTAGKMAYVKGFCELMAKVPSAVERELYAARTASELGVSKEAIVSQIGGLLTRNARAEKKRQQRDIKIFDGFEGKIEPGRRENLAEAVIEDKILTILLKNPDYFTTVALSPEDFVTAFNRELYAAVLGRIKSNLSIDVTSLASIMSTDQISKVAGLLAKSAQINFAKEDLAAYVTALKNQNLKKAPAVVADMSEDEFARYMNELSAGKGAKKS